MLVNRSGGVLAYWASFLVQVRVRVKVRVSVRDRVRVSSSSARIRMWSLYMG